MAEAIFGLIGVIVGGILQSGAAWTMERRREDWAARKAGRLIAHAFGRCQWYFAAAAQVQLTWGLVGHEVRRALEAWRAHADTFAGTATQADWNTVREAVNHLERLEQRASVADSKEELSDDDSEFLEFVSEGPLWNSAFVASMIGATGTRLTARRLVRRIRNSFKSQQRLEEEAAAVGAAFQKASGLTGLEDSSDESEPEPGSGCRPDP